MNVIAIQTASSRVCHIIRLSRLTSLLQQIAGRGHVPLTTHTPAITPTATTSLPPSPSSFESDLQRLIDSPPQVARVDDPFADISLLAVRGEISHGTIGQLQDSLADLGRGRFVHFDLSDSSILTTAAMRGLESIADDLEWRGIVLRVVGLDPQHPMLSPTL
jgi:MFS superfamily sulfate permease-like transporter